MTIEIMHDRPEGPQPAHPYRFSAYERMALSRRWMMWKAVQRPGKAKPDKVPYYADGAARGETDTPNDVARLVPYHLAKQAVEARGTDWGLAFALGPDGQGGHWQGVDLDAVVENGLADLANGAPGYVELSPSEKGAHALGYGRSFATLGSNGSGVEAYAGRRFFTVTEHLIRDSGLICLADYVERVLVPRHGKARSAPSRVNGVEIVSVDPKTVTELRSALLSMRADNRDDWIAVGHALKELGEVGRGLWLDWSATSDKFNPAGDSKTWDGFEPRGTGYQAVFKRAQDQGWVNPASKIAQLQHPAALEGLSPASVTLEFAAASDTATIRLEYLLDPFLPKKCVVGFYGRGSTSKSSFVATMAARVSRVAGSLWVSVEEPDDWIKVRHIASGGADKTLLVVKAIPTKHDAQGRVSGSTFNIYEHLEPAIIQSQKAFAEAGRPPLGLVVLDTAVGLTGWAKGETPNDDASVKRLLAHLQALAERYNVTVALIGHANKGNYEHIADTVMGATAWTNSPRLSFVHAADRREDYAYVMRVAKTNLVTFGAPYRTVPVHTLYERQDGPDSVLVRVECGPIVWGDMASMEMFTDATKKPKGDEEIGDAGGFQQRAPTLVEQVMEHLTAMVAELAPGEHVTRDAVELHLGKPIDRVRWTKVDLGLQLHPVVNIERGPKNAVLYKRRTEV